MTLFEEITNGLQSGIDALHNGQEIKETCVEFEASPKGDNDEFEAKEN